MAIESTALKIGGTRPTPYAYVACLPHTDIPEQPYGTILTVVAKRSGEFRKIRVGRLRLIFCGAPGPIIPISLHSYINPATISRPSTIDCSTLSYE